MAEKGDAGDADDAADEEGDGVRLVEHVQRDLVHLAVIHRPACASIVSHYPTQSQVRKLSSTSLKLEFLMKSHRVIVVTL